MLAITPDAIKREYENQLPQISKLSKTQLEKDKQDILDKAERLKLQADEFFASDEVISRYRKAWAYRASATIYLEMAECLGSPGEKVELYEKAGWIFHFAGHAFRKEEEYRWAGECYLKSGESFKECAEVLRKDKHGREALVNSLDNAIRAYRRAKGVFGEVGDYDFSGRAYYQEQRLLTERLFRSKRPRWLVRAAWGLFTGYGEKISSWFVAYFLGVFIFASIQIAQGLGYLPSLLLASERSLLIPTSGGSAIILIAQTIYSYFILGLGLTIVTRKMQSR